MCPWFCRHSSWELSYFFAPKWPWCQRINCLYAACLFPLFKSVPGTVVMISSLYRLAASKTRSLRTTLWKSWKHDKKCYYRVWSNSVYSIYGISVIRSYRNLLNSNLFNWFFPQQSFLISEGIFRDWLRVHQLETPPNGWGGILVVFLSVRPHLEYKKQKLGPVHTSFQQSFSEFVLQVWQKFPKNYDSCVKIVQAIQDGISLKL